MGSYYGRSKRNTWYSQHINITYQTSPSTEEKQLSAAELTRYSLCEGNHPVPTEDWMDTSAFSTKWSQVLENLGSSRFLEGLYMSRWIFSFTLKFYLLLPLFFPFPSWWKVSILCSRKIYWMWMLSHYLKQYTFKYWLREKIFWHVSFLLRLSATGQP